MNPLRTFSFDPNKKYLIFFLISSLFFVLEQFLSTRALIGLPAPFFLASLSGSSAQAKI
jgi:hypothetical protein